MPRACPRPPGARPTRWPSSPRSSPAVPAAHPRRRGAHLRPSAPRQVVALGLVSGEHAYLQSSWNVLDGLLVLVSLVDIVVAMASAGGAKILGILRVLRLLRTLRPLRWARWGGGLRRGRVSVLPRAARHRLPSARVQGHQPRPGPQAGGGDSDLVPQAHRKHRPHLLRLLRHLRHPGCAGAHPGGPQGSRAAAQRPTRGGCAGRRLAGRSG